MRVFHSTSTPVAATIQREGFRDAEGSYMFSMLGLTGQAVLQVVP